MKKECFSCVLIKENRICFVIFDQAENQVEKWESASWRGRGCRETLTHIIEELKKHGNNIIFGRVILCIPGEITQNGICQCCTELGWGKVSPEKVWKELSEVPVKVVREKNMFLLGELRKQNFKRKQSGSHRGAIFLGEKLETALLINGVFIGDQQGNYSDLGKVPIYFGNTDNKQPYSRLRQEASYAEMEIKYGKLRRKYAYMLHSISCGEDIHEIAKTAKEGNPLAGKVIDEAAEAVVRGILCFSAVIALECVFICGKENEINELLKKRILFFSEKYELKTSLYFTVPDDETEILGCIDFTLFL